MTAADILETITEYKVYPITDGTADETKTLSIDEYFWGVAYNQGEKTQSYEPVFVIEEGTKCVIIFLLVACVAEW